jgi:hypothetical protein
LATKQVRIGEVGLGLVVGHFLVGGIDGAEIELGNQVEEEENEIALGQFALREMVCWR